MHFLDQVIESLTKSAQNHQHDGSIIIATKAFLAKITLSGAAPFMGFVSAIFLTISNAEINEAMRTLYLFIAILFISMSLLWSSWKNKSTTNEMIKSLKEKIKNGKNIKPPLPHDGTDPAREIMHNTKE